MLSRQVVPALSAQPMSVDADQVASAQIDLLAVPAEVKAQIKYAILDPASWNTNAYVALLRLVEALAGASLDATWAAAEAALPEGWEIAKVTRVRLRYLESMQRWGAQAAPIIPRGRTWRAQHVTQFGDGLTPTAALHALAAELRRRRK